MPSIIVEVSLVNGKDGQQLDKSSKKKINRNLSSEQKWAVLLEFIEKRICTNVSFANYTFEISDNNDKVISSQEDFAGMLSLPYAF